MSFRKSKRRKMEFSKLLAIWVLIIITVSVIVSFYLSYYDHQTVSDVTIALITGGTAYLVSYAAKSTTEKISRNRHQLDENGKPIKTNSNNSKGGVG